MPLQNRVDPFGDIHAVAARGMFTGNRGVIHEPTTKTLLKRRWTTKAWIVCACDFRGRRRTVMGRNAPSGNAGWTELFFLDEATAFAAGHRPCFYCRREAATTFAACFAAGNGLDGARAPAIDAILHRERLTPLQQRGLVRIDAVSALPDGAMVAFESQALLVVGGALRRWTFSGYGPAPAFSSRPDTRLRLVTPPATLAALKAGYNPVLHETARASSSAARTA
ncbi:hypothetical protein GN330_20380 [Nitratireductor sp. CAU 1489]|uniref:Uncharacterized protein n=1 Tax=Nitratireductor arenosus TaxID=2682096 RepID=A0A844QJ80_9HYPH|nr:hypothetical protein [Nitratireductor arenosus]MVA99612.1 hypothetical protein [Nitratireductor arenosus]